MQEAFDVLQEAIGDVGYWRWWVAKLPGSFQIEFGSVQLYQPPQDISQPPSGVFALRFEQPRMVEFLEFSKKVEDDWFMRLQRDEIKPFPVGRDDFLLGELAACEALRHQAVRVHVHFQAQQPKGSVCLAFRAGSDVGIFIAADGVRLLSHSGEIPLESVPALHGDWWSYWRRYWKLKDTDKELPRDDTCEVCIPAGD